jgi:hypothetical protein
MEVKPRSLQEMIGSLLVARKEFTPTKKQVIS